MDAHLKLLDTVDRGIGFLNEVLVSRLLSTTAIEILSYSDNVREQMRQLMREKIDWTAPGSVHRVPPEKLDRIIELAQKDVEGGFPVSTNQTLVSLWAGLEFLVQEVIFATLLAYPQKLDQIAGRNLKIKASDLMIADYEDRLRILVSKIEQSVEPDEKQGVEKFEGLLKHVGLSGPLDTDVRGLLNELKAIRNAVVHRAATVDRRLKEQASHSGFEVGAAIRVSEPAFRQYAGAVMAYAYAVRERVGRQFANLSL